jgi:putative ABC transport system permease protein
MFPTVFRAQITPMTYVIGFIPGVLSTVIGAMLAGIGIYKRQTAQLFKELT